MNWISILGFIFLFQSIASWDCSGHLLIMKIALLELNQNEKAKLNKVLKGLTSGVSSFRTLEAACFHNDMIEAGFTAFIGMRSHELPFYDGISEKESNFTWPFIGPIRSFVNSITIIG